MKNIHQAQHKLLLKKKGERFFLTNREQLLGCCFFILVTIICGWILYHLINWIDDPKRVLSEVEVNGDNRFTSKHDIEQAMSEIGQLDTYLSQDVIEIQKGIVRLPWLKDVSVQKKWPDKIIISIVEYEPIFFWNDIFLLDNDANIFMLPFDSISSLYLPKLYGPQDKQKSVVETYYKLKHIDDKFANEQLKLQIQSITADERNTWELIATPCIANWCDNKQNIKVLLGNKNIDQKYLQFLKVYPEIQKKMADKERLAVADLRYENGLSVKKEMIK